ncbi:MAG: hypothetical protein JNK37_17415 [Verrucomicrobiales bacterium]|nr:hypothetical protein [Verrucomicrobiales bacterium]
MKLRTKIALALTVFLHALAATNLRAQVELGDLAGQWEGSGAISVATINSNGAVEFTATTRTAKTKSPWNKVVASLVSKDGGTITLSSYTHIGNAVRGPLAGTYNVATDSITWANKAVWKRRFDPAMAKKIESLQSKAEEKNVLPKDAPIVGVGDTPPAPVVPTSGRTLRVRNDGLYVAVFHAKWLNKATNKAEEWTSGNLSTFKKEATWEVPENADVLELWAIGIGAAFGAKDKMIFRTKNINFGKKYVVEGPIETGLGGGPSHRTE